MENENNGSRDSRKKRQHKQLRPVWKFAGKTSMHGVSSIVVSEEQTCSWTQLLWLVVLIVGFCGAGNQIQKQTAKYFSRPIRTLIEMSDTNFEFPDITICDQLAPQFLGRTNPLKSEWKKLFDNFTFYQRRVYGDMYYKKLVKLSDSMMNILYKEYKNKTLSNNAAPIDYSPEYQDAIQYFANLNSTYPWAIDTIIYCRYKQKPCSFKNFSITYHPVFKNCYTFQIEDRADRIITIEADVEDNFLRIALLSPQLDDFSVNFTKSRDNDDFGRLSQGTPVLVKTRQHGNMPTAKDSTIDSSIGMATSVLLGQQNIKFITDTSYRCMETKKVSVYHSDKEAPDQMSVYNYEKSLCKEQEFQLYVLKTCGCLADWEVVIPEDPEQREFVQKHINNSNFCTNFNKVLQNTRFTGSLSEPSSDYLEELQRGNTSFESLRKDLDNATGKSFTESLMCYWQLQQNKARNKLPYRSNCLKSCEYVYYLQTITQNQWPISRDFKKRGSRSQINLITKVFKEYYRMAYHHEKDFDVKLQLTQLLKNHGFQDPAAVNFDACKFETYNVTKCMAISEMFNNNMLWLSISPIIDTVITFREEVYYLFWDWLSDIGGTMGLWVGVSFVTLMECNELLLSCFKLLVKKLARKITKFRRQKQENAGNNPSTPRDYKMEEISVSQWL